MPRFLTRPESLLFLTFGGLILTGSLLLRIPTCQQKPVGYLDCLFTATSAVCVTGLVTVDTEQSWTRAGHVVILCLIQLGGLGVMTFTALAAHLLRRPVSFSSAVALHDAFFESESRGDLGRALAWIVGMTLLLELCGAGVIYVGLANSAAVAPDPFAALFLAVSAFCNAGFSVYSDNLVCLRPSLLIMFTIMTLITLGGLGYSVLLETLQRVKRRIRGRTREQPLRWSLHMTIVLFTSAILTFGGALALLGADAALADDPSIPHLGWTDALFHSISARTAGFNAVPMDVFSIPSILILIGLMFIGGSPGSTAGGIKTTSAAVWTAGIYAGLRGRESLNLLGRRLPPDVLRRAGLVVALTTIWNVIGFFVLAVTENDRFRFEQLIFEQVSAFCTVGYSLNVSAGLSELGKLWIVASMLVGRLGAVTVAFLVIRPRREHFRYPQERVMIG